MALLSTLAIGGGIGYVAWKSATLTTKWVVFTYLASLPVESLVVGPDGDFGPLHLLLSAAVGGAAAGVV